MSVRSPWFGTLRMLRQVRALYAQLQSRRERSNPASQQVRSTKAVASGQRPRRVQPAP